MPVTSKDIAREVNLSQPTVSRILNGQWYDRVTPETRERVFEAAKRMGYQTNRLASALRHGRTRMIGFYTDHNYENNNPFFSDIVGSLQVACKSHHLDLLFYSSFQGRSTEEIYSGVRDGRVDGLILHAAPDDPLVAKLGESDLPVVAITDPVDSLPSVACDDEDGMRQLAAYLWTQGYRRVIFMEPSQDFSSVRRRREGLRAALVEQGLNPGDFHLIRIELEDAQGTLEPVRKWAGGGERVVVACWNDLTALSLLRECSLAGAAVPGELGVCGFDGFFGDRLPPYRLVSVKCPWRQVAATALDRLVARINHEEIQHYTQLPVEL